MFNPGDIIERVRSIDKSLPVGTLCEFVRYGGIDNDTSLLYIKHPLKDNRVEWFQTNTFVLHRPATPASTLSFEIF